MNLCVNARDAMPQGGVLTIGLDKKELDAAGADIHPKAKPGGYVVISVTDTGTGIPPELRGQDFRSVFHHQTARPGHRPGIAHGAGHRRKPRRLCASRNPVGLRARHSMFIFPPRPASRGDADPQRRAGRAAKGKGELILVVDDEPSVRKLASAILSRDGYRTVTAAEGQEGMKMFEQHRPDIRLVVSDLMMPQLDGPGMMRGLRQSQPELKSIIITGLGEENRIAEAKAAGADLILNKPFTGGSTAGQRQTIARLTAVFS